MSKRKKIVRRLSDGKEWPSIAAAARDLGCAACTLRNYLVNGRDYNGAKYEVIGSGRFAGEELKTWICEQDEIRFRSSSSSCPLCGEECFAAIRPELYRFLPSYIKKYAADRK